MNAAGAVAPRWRQVIGGEDRELARLRRWLAGLLPGCAARDDVIAVAHELAANAARHTASGQPGGWTVIEITWHPGQVRVAVADQGGPAAGPHLTEDPQGEHGRGLHVVEALSARWSVSGDHRGRLVCADVPWAGAGAAPPPGFGAGYEAAIRDATGLLASHHPGMTAWFSRATQQWWAMAPGDNGTAELVPARSPQELDRLL